MAQRIGSICLQALGSLNAPWQPPKNIADWQRSDTRCFDFWRSFTPVLFIFVGPWSSLRVIWCKSFCIYFFRSVIWERPRCYDCAHVLLWQGSDQRLHQDAILLLLLLMALHCCCHVKVLSLPFWSFSSSCNLECADFCDLLEGLTNALVACVVVVWFCYTGEASHPGIQFFFARPDLYQQPSVFFFF